MEKCVYIYTTSPNQKSIITEKAKADNEHLYGKCNIEAMLSAARVLSDRAFKLYTRMNLHRDGFAYALSPAAIMHDIGMSDKRYRDAVKELIEKGFLVQNEKHRSLYVFNELPKQNNDRIISPVHPAKTDVSNGQTGQMIRTNEAVNPATSGVEIQQNITSHTTNDTTNNTTQINVVNYLIQKKEDRKSGFNSWCLDDGYYNSKMVYDEDDICMYQPVEDVAVEIADDDDLPF